MTDLVFLPWARRGFARAIATTRSQANRANPPITFDVTLAGDAAGAIATSARLLGAGDVVGIDAKQVLKTDPPSNNFDFEPNYLASVEFKAPDLPWMFTPWTHDSNRLEPWIALIVLEKLADDLIKSDPTRPLPFVTIASGAELPNLSQSWAWAHVQVSGATSQADARSKLESAPESCLSRVICPRRLEGRKSYVACVVPAFEIGRKAGLGIPLASADLEGQNSTSFAWKATDAGVELPVYHSWEFGTGAGGDFESLVWELQRPSEPRAEQIAGLGRAPMNVVAPLSWPTVPASAPPVFFEGALQPVAAVAPIAPAPAASTARLTAALNTAVPGSASAGDPELPLPPPLYGRWHAGRSTVPTQTDTKAWLATLNLDLGLRAAAGLGAKIVQEQQESLMAAAWQQVGEIERANQLLRQGQLSRSGSVALFKSRFESMAAATLLQLAAPVASRVAERWSQSAVLGKTPKETLAAHLSTSAVSGVVLSAQFRRATRSGGPLARRFGRAGSWSAELIKRWNDGAITLDRGRRKPPGTITIDGLTRDLTRLRVCELTRSHLWNERGLAFGPLEMVNARIAALLQSLRSTAATVDPYPGLAAVVKRFAASVARLQRALQGARVDWREAFEAIRQLILLQAALFSELARAGLDPAAAADVRARFEALRDWITTTCFPAPTPQEALQLERQFLLDLALIDAQAGMPACPPRRPPRKPKLDLERIAAVLLTRLDPRRTIAARVKSRIGMGSRSFEFHTRSDGDELEPVMAAPRFDLPMYKALVEQSPSYLLPGIEGLARNSIGLLQANRRFIEAFMVGLNHEMAGELLWREFPTDQRGTYFHQFWDAAPAAQPAADIGEISEWTGLPLGKNLPSQTAANPAVLVLRGDLPRRYPRVLIFLQQAKWTGTGTAARRRLDTQTVQPTFRGTLPPDITFLGFPALEATALIGSEDPSADDPGYFVVLQEPIGELRFGLNETAPDQRENTWRDLGWPDVTVTNHHLDLAGATVPAPPTTANNASFGMTSDAAQMAYILLQRPVRVAVHASDLIMAGAR